MKTFLIFFALFFLVFSIVGFINGRQDVNDPRSLELHIFKRVSHRDISGTQYLSYAKGEDTILMFNIDTDSLIILNKEILLHPTEKTVSDRNLLNYLNSTAITATASGALGWSVKDFVPKFNGGEKIKGKSNAGAVFGAILGAASGYYVGYWLAAKYTVPDENSNVFTPILTSRAKWISAKERIVQQLFKECKSTIGRIPEMRTRVSLAARLKSYVKSLQFEGNKPQITSRNFSELIAIYNKARSAVPN